VPAETVLILVAGLAIQPELYGTLCLKWSSVLELCCVTLQFRVSIGFVYKSLQRRANTDAGITSTTMNMINHWYVRIKIANVM